MSCWIFCEIFIQVFTEESLTLLLRRQTPLKTSPHTPPETNKLEILTRKCCRMGGVNTSHDYVTLMGFGYVDDAGTVVTTDALLKGGIVSVYYLGTLFGCLLGGWVGDKVGRTRTIALGAAWAVLGASLQCSSQNHSWMICGELRMARPAFAIQPGVTNDP